MKSGHERRIRADDREVDPLLLGESDQRVEIHRPDRNAFGDAFDSRIAGCAIELAQERTSRECPCQSMFTPSRSYQQYFQGDRSMLAARIGVRGCPSSYIMGKSCRKPTKPSGRICRS